MNPLRSSCGAADCDTPRSSSLCRHFELAHQFERLVAFCDFLHRQIAQTLQAECFHAKTSQHAAVNHGFTQVIEVDLLYRAGEIAGHAAGECVPCPGRIVNVFEWIRATTEELIAFTKKQRAVLTFFYCDVGGPHLSNATPGFDQA